MTSDPEELGFLAFTLAFAPSGQVRAAVRSQISKWWKQGTLDNDFPSELAPFRLKKEHNPKSIQIAVFEIESLLLPATLIEANLNDGYSSLMHMVSAALPDHRLVTVRSSARDDEWPIQEFAVLLAGRHLRFIRAMRESDGWEYWEEGKIQTFEEPAQYLESRKKNRVTRDLILRYLDRLGIDFRMLAMGKKVRSSVFYVQG